MFLCRECMRRTLPIPYGISRSKLNGTRPPPAQRAAGAHLFATAADRAKKTSLTHEVMRSKAPAKSRRDAAIAKATHFHKDPYTIAEYVRSVLKQDRYDEAMEVVLRATSRGEQVVVSWNHLIEYNMTKQRPKMAFKVFTEMKKRGQLPNAQTYTVIFAGYASLTNPTPYIPEGLRLYQLMRENKRVPPNIIHLNNLLNACARAQDLESLYMLLGDVTETGPLAPDPTTYTVTFNALRAYYRRPSLGSANMDSIQQEKERTMTLHKASLIWGDARRRWSQGKLKLDEASMCAYGRLVLEEGTPEATEEVFTLANEIMNLPLPSNIVEAASTPASSVSGKSASLVPSRNVGSAGIYAQPGNNAFSLILTACETPQRVGKASYYWKYLTAPPFSIRPDKENYHQYLRTLRKAHNSVKSLEAVLAMPPPMLAPKTFRIALSTCVRDNLNAQAFDHAGKMLDVMAQSLPHPDPQALRVYLRAAAMVGRREYMKAGQVGTLAYTRQLSRALDRLWDPVRLAWDQAFGGAPMWNLPDLSDEAEMASLRVARDREIKQKLAEREVGYRVLDLKELDKEDQEIDLEEEAWLGLKESRRIGRGGDDPEASAVAKHLVRYNEQREVVAVARRMLAMYDRVIDIGGDQMSARDLKLMRERRNRLNGRVVKFFEDRELREPLLPSAVRKAHLRQEKMRIEQARMRYQRPEKHRFVNV